MRSAREDREQGSPRSPCQVISLGLLHRDDSHRDRSSFRRAAFPDPRGPAEPTSISRPRPTSCPIFHRNDLLHAQQHEQFDPPRPRGQQDLRKKSSSAGFFLNLDSRPVVSLRRTGPPPAMGISGNAWATVVIQALGGCLSLFATVIRRRYVTIRHLSFTMLLPDLKNLSAKSLQSGDSHRRST